MSKRKNIEILGLDAILDSPDQKSDMAILIVPGESGDPLNPQKRYEQIAQHFVASGYNVLRVQGWRSKDELMDQNPAFTVAQIYHATDYLESSGVAQYMGIFAKSFGGALALLHSARYPGESTCLWAPAIDKGLPDTQGRIDHRGSNSQEMLKSNTWSEVDKWDLIPTYGLVTEPIQVIQGTADKRVSLEHSRRLVDRLPNAELATIEGAGHSDYLEEVCRYATQFFDKHLKP